MKNTLLIFIVTLFFYGGNNTAFSQSFAWKKKFNGSNAFGTTVGFNPLNEHTVYAEGPDGLYVSYNTGTDWSLLGLPGISGMRQILISPSDTTIIFCVEFGGGLRRSTDNGATWTGTIPNFGIDGETVTYNLSNPDEMYAGNFEDGTVYHSMDKGGTWSTMGQSGTNMCALAVRPDSSNILLAGTGQGRISKSTDSGVTWRLVKTGGSAEIPRIIINPQNPLIAYAAGYSGPADKIGVWKTIDGGETWVLTSLGGVSIWSLELDRQHPDVVYAGSFSEDISAVYKTTDGGATWLSINRGLAPGCDLWSLKVSPLNPDIVWLSLDGGGAGSPGIYALSKGLGSMTGHVYDAVTNELVTNGTIASSSNNDVINLALTNGAFDIGYFTNDSLNTTVAVRSYPYVPYEEQVAFIMDSTIEHNIYLTKLPTSFIAGTIQVFGTSDPLQSEVRLFHSTPAGNSVLVETTGVQGTFRFDSVYISEPLINSYTKVEVTPLNVVYGVHSTNPIALDTSGVTLVLDLKPSEVFLVGEDDSNYVSYYRRALDSLKITYGFWNTHSRGAAPFQLGAQFGKKTVIYFSGKKHTPFTQAEEESLRSYLQNGGNLFITGQNIVEQNDSTPLFANDLGVSFASNTTEAYVKGSHIGEILGTMGFPTTGSGANNQTSRDVLHTANPNAHIVSNYGINGGNGIAALRIEHIGSNNSRVVLFGYGFEAISGVNTRKTVLQKVIAYFDSTITLGVEREPTSLPAAYSLSQNYPNPFNPSTVIRYSLPVNSIVSLRVFNILGQQVATLLNNQKVESGEHDVKFNASNLSSGIYFYRLNVNDGAFVQTKKLVLMK